jgi:hypothetical protein
MKLHIDPDKLPLFTWRKGLLASWPLAIELLNEAGQVVQAVYWVSWLHCDSPLCSILFYKLPDQTVIKFQPKPQSTT